VVIIAVGVAANCLVGSHDGAVVSNWSLTIGLFASFLS